MDYLGWRGHGCSDTGNDLVRVKARVRVGVRVRVRVRVRAGVRTRI